MMFLNLQRSRSAVWFGVVAAACPAAIHGSFAKADSCFGVERHQTPPEGWHLSPATIAWLDGKLAQEAPPLDAKKVRFEESFTYQGWQITAVETGVSDDAFLFFKGNPLKSPPITLWSGGGTVFDEQPIFQWTKENAPGIPRQLAGCFAQSVTPQRR